MLSGGSGGRFSGFGVALVPTMVRRGPLKGVRSAGPWRLCQNVLPAGKQGCCRLPYEPRTNSVRTPDKHVALTKSYVKICFQTHETAAFIGETRPNRLQIRSKSVILSYFLADPYVGLPKFGGSGWGSYGVRAEFVRSSYGA